MKNNKRAIVLGFVFASFFLVLSCAKPHSRPTSILTPTATPPGWIIQWLENPACSPPCWETIQPGVTSIDTVQDIQKRYPDMQVLTARGDPIITMIALHFSLYDSLPIELIFSKYGQPNYMRMFKCDPNGRCETHVVYSKLGMILNVYPEMGKNQFMEITSTTNILKIYFLEPGLDNYYSFFGDGWGKLNSWHGYGLYP